jgi:hypothetical protein
MEQAELNIDRDTFVLFTEILQATLKINGIKINREQFLKKELAQKYPRETVQLAIANNPAYAGISESDIYEIASTCIGNETRRATLISFATGLPGGFALLATVPSDVLQFFAHLVRVVQKLAYLYGWKELYNQQGEFDEESELQFTVFIATLVNVELANELLKNIARNEAIGIEKNLANQTLNKSLIYPLFKKIAIKVGYKLSSKLIAKSLGKIIPILGGVISGIFTYTFFKSSVEGFRDFLKTLPLASAEFFEETHEEELELDQLFHSLDNLDKIE